VVGGYAGLLGIEHGLERPVGEVEAVVVAMARQRPQRFLGNDLGQNDVVVGIGELELFRVELRVVGRKHVAPAGFVGFYGLVRGAERDDFVLHVVGAEVVGEIELGRGAGL